MAKTCVIVTCISIFSKISFLDYKTDKGNGEKITALLTNEAGVQYLLRRIIENNREVSENVNIVLILLESKEVNETTKKDRKTNVEENKNQLIESYREKLKSERDERYIKLSCIQTDRPLNEVVYFTNRMEYEWKELNPKSNFQLSKEVKHIRVNNKNEKECESQFMACINELKEKCDEIELYMDESGGQRDINYTFALLLRMLEYSNITCKDIVYSNINNENDHIISSILHKHRYVDIITGLDEFVKYGKTEMLIEQLKQLGIANHEKEKVLLHAMQNYSEQLLLCDVEGFNLANRELKQAIKDYTKPNVEGTNHILRILLPELEKRIALDNEKERVPFLLRKCIDNDMLQQAITIYNELVPKYLIETLEVLKIEGLQGRARTNSRNKIEALLHGMQIGECRYKNRREHKDISNYNEVAKRIAHIDFSSSINLDRKDGYKDLFIELLKEQNSEHDFGKYTCTYYVFKNIDLWENEIQFPKMYKNAVIDVLKDYLEIREIRNVVNHASDFDAENISVEKQYREQYFRLPAFKGEKISYKGIKKSMEKAIEHLEVLKMNESKMEKELQNVPVLAMYDVRGIQDYIFRTNRVKEIIGASEIVDDIIMETIKEASDFIKKEEKIIEWNKLDTKREFLSNPNYKMEVLFIGGGNAYVLYQTGLICEQVNRQMSKAILENTYSLQLAIAVVEAHINGNTKGFTYKDDYEKLREKMDEVKAKMPLTRTIGALPIAKIDSVTGFPLVVHDTDYIENTTFKQEVEQGMSQETFLKLNKYYQGKKEEDENNTGEGKIVREFDQFITEKGEESILAIVHIDGNEIGDRISSILSQHNKSYSDAIETMRTLSNNINRTFKTDVFDKLKAQFEKWIQNHTPEGFKPNGTYLRKIIVAGDDVTFVCNARFALPLVKHFVNHVSKYVMYGSKDKTDDRDKYGFSICAGIAFLNSHFPFHIGYQVAEACCDNAKKIAKKTENLEKNGRIGNWVDFQICRNAQMGDLELARKKNYTIGNNIELLQRPFHISVSGEKQEENKLNEYSVFEKQITALKDYPRSKVMQLRNTYPKGKDATNSLCTFLKSRDSENKLSEIFKDNEPFVRDNDIDKAACYDALEVFELYETIEFEEDE